jgi:hypothetical protein
MAHLQAHYRAQLDGPKCRRQTNRLKPVWRAELNLLYQNGGHQLIGVSSRSLGKLFHSHQNLPWIGHRSLRRYTFCHVSSVVKQLVNLLNQPSHLSLTLCCNSSGATIGQASVIASISDGSKLNAIETVSASAR